MEISNEEYESMKQALAKANEEAKTFRLERNELREQLTAADKEREQLSTELDSLKSEAESKTIVDKLKANNLPSSLAKYLTVEDIDSQISEFKQSMNYNEDAAEQSPVSKPKSMGELLVDSLK